MFLSLFYFECVRCIAILVKDLSSFVPSALLTLPISDDNMNMAFSLDIPLY